MTSFFTLKLRIVIYHLLYFQFLNKPLVKGGLVASHQNKNSETTLHEWFPVFTLLFWQFHGPMTGVSVSFLYQPCFLPCNNMYRKSNWAKKGPLGCFSSLYCEQSIKEQSSLLYSEVSREPDWKFLFTICINAMRWHLLLLTVFCKDLFNLSMKNIDAILCLTINNNCYFGGSYYIIINLGQGQLNKRKKNSCLYFCLVKLLIRI